MWSRRQSLPGDVPGRWNTPRLGSGVADREALDAVEPARAQPHRVAGPADARHGVGDRAEDKLDLQPGQAGAQAEVGAAAAEAEVRVGAPADVEPFRVVEHLVVEVGRPVEQAHPLPGPDLL